MNNFDYLIGKKCTYLQEFDCQIIGFQYITEDKFPYTAHVLVKLLPFQDVDEDNSNDMLDGVGLEYISNIEV